MSHNYNIFVHMNFINAEITLPYRRFLLYMHTLLSSLCCPINTSNTIGELADKTEGGFTIALCGGFLLCTYMALFITFSPTH